MDPMTLIQEAAICTHQAQKRKHRARVFEFTVTANARLGWTFKPHQSPSDYSVK